MQFLLNCLNIFFLPVDNPQILEENEPFWEKFASVADPNPDPVGSVLLDPDPTQKQEQAEGGRSKQPPHTEC